MSYYSSWTKEQLENEITLAEEELSYKGEEVLNLENCINDMQRELDSRETKMSEIITKRFKEQHVVLFRESERGWGSDFWEKYYDTEAKAQEAVYNCNKDLPLVAPDYYIMAEYKGKKLVEIKDE